MNYDYEMIRSTLKESVIDSCESSIEKALREFGYDKFPEVGLDDMGKNKLINRIMEIEKDEARLILRKEKSLARKKDLSNNNKGLEYHSEMPGETKVTLIGGGYY